MTTGTLLLRREQTEEVESEEEKKEGEKSDSDTMKFDNGMKK